MAARRPASFLLLLLLASCSGSDSGNATTAQEESAERHAELPVGGSEPPVLDGDPLPAAGSEEPPSRIYGVPPTSSVDLSKVEIRLDRTECYGWCPNYSIVITGCGQVRYIGRTFVLTIGEREATLPEKTIRELLTRFDGARFFDLKDEYTQSVTDLDSVILSLTVGGREKKVLNYWVGADHEWGLDAPDREIHIALDSIALAIDQAVGIEQWIGTNDERRAIRDKFKTGWPGRMGGK